MRKLISGTLTIEYIKNGKCVIKRIYPLKEMNCHAKNYFLDVDFKNMEKNKKEIT